MTKLLGYEVTRGIMTSALYAAIVKTEMAEIANYISQILIAILPCGKPIKIAIEDDTIVFLIEWPGEYVKQLRIKREIDLDGPIAPDCFGARMAKDIRLLEKLDAPMMLEKAFEFDPYQDSNR